MVTFEEENAVRYVGGYILWVLKKQTLDSDVVRILDMDTWVGVVDRGGLVVITEEAYQLFYVIESYIRRYLTVSNAR